MYKTKSQKKQAISALISMLWSRTITNKNKKRIYNTTFGSITLYASEMWQLNSQQQKL